MIPLFDMMMQAQNGNAMETMAKQFGLAHEQMAQAAAVLMPAFSTGLKSKTTNPYDFGALMSAMASGNHAKYFEDITAAFTPQGTTDGNTILGQIFGSKEVSRAIAAQAAQMTGIGQDIYKQMLPIMASSIMGGLFKQATGQATGTMGQNPFAGNPMMTMAQQWMEATGFAKKPEPAPNPFDNPFTQTMQSFFGMGKAEEKPQVSNPFSDNPFAKAFQDMMAGVTPKPVETPIPEQTTAKAVPFAEMFGTMFDSGLEAQKEYQKTLDALLDPYRNAAQTPKA